MSPGLRSAVRARIAKPSTARSRRRSARAPAGLWPAADLGALGRPAARVALARALINRPTVLLLDEPLAALDRKLRREMQIELQNLQREVGITFILVTHDQEEALSMGDTIGIMRDGRIEQLAARGAL